MIASTLKERITVAVPVLKARVKVVSQQLNELGQFSQYILFAFGNGYRLEDILAVVKLEPHVIQEEIRYLNRIGLITEEDGSSEIRLTSKGQGLFQIMGVVKRFNHQGEGVLINGVTGLIEPLEEGEIYHSSELSGKACKVKEKIVRTLYRNPNPSNSKKFVLSHFPLGDLDDEQKEELQIELRYESVPYYIEKQIEQLPSPQANVSLANQGVVQEDEINQLESYLHVERVLHKINIDLKRTELDPYRTVLDSLEKLRQFDQGLISQKAEHVLLQAEEELQKNKEDHLFFFDPVTGQHFLDRPQYPYEHAKPWTDLTPARFYQEDKMPDHHSLYLLFGEQDRRGEVKREEAYTIRQRIPYDVLFQKVTETSTVEEEGAERTWTKKERFVFSDPLKKMYNT